MRRKRPPNQAGKTPRGGQKTIVPEVPTFQPDPKTLTQPPPQGVEDDDAVNEAIRRMIEAAYT